ncbi:MurR/RpiR family transcriptional regulator [Paenibacillus antri]|uniref:MurR/RpiR family transcriptional regulator n=1 Tax=Paenibacillus antri TaxID=2582848 RepID=A0A5R9G769_9BACL|nr:MurR/RpiR family transcriptional regulator [Paenibacillus antri]TLS50919.1 MurR/RpiR family transcriptional regulator [Paenibacillus antri]
MNGGLVRIREVIDQVNPSERKVAAYILEHPQDMIEQSVAQLAANSGASQAAIVRLCKSLGVKSYQELKLKVAGDLQERKHESSATGYSDIQPNDSIQSIIESVSNNNIQSIRDTVKIVDAAAVERAVAALNGAKRIFFFGVGASNLIAMDAQQKFLRINKTSLSFPDPHVQLTSAVTMTADDAAVGISYSGETSEIIRALTIAKEHGATTISITKYGDNTVSRTADIPLFTSSTETEIRSGAMASRISQLNVVDILYIGVASRNYDSAVTYLEESRRAIRQR